MAPSKSFEELGEKFKHLTSRDVDYQMELFMKSFIFELDDDWKKVAELSKQFSKYVRDFNEGYPDLNPIQAADFLQKNGLERTALERKEEVLDIDLDYNNRICFVEYLLLHYKVMILQTYYKRTGDKCIEDLSRGGIGVTGVGHKLLDELFSMPVGLPPELEKAIEDFAAAKRKRENRLTDLEGKVKLGGVKGMTAKNEIAQMDSEDLTLMNKLELTLNAAKKKASKDSGEVALEKKKKAQEQEERLKRQESRNKLAQKASLWENK